MIFKVTNTPPERVWEAIPRKEAGRWANAWGRVSGQISGRRSEAI